MAPHDSEGGQLGCTLSTTCTIQIHALPLCNNTARFTVSSDGNNINHGKTGGQCVCTVAFCTAATVGPVTPLPWSHSTAAVNSAAAASAVPVPAAT